MTHREAALLPCPFCGEQLIRNDHPKRRISDTELTTYRHPHCSCYLAGFQLDENDIECWNRRATLPDEGEVERLRAKPAECEKDARRLDAIQGLAAKEMEPYQYTEDGLVKWRVDFSHTKTGTFNTFREAIDAAMKEAK